MNRSIKRNVWFYTSSECFLINVIFICVNYVIFHKIYRGRFRKKTSIHLFWDKAVIQQMLYGKNTRYLQSFKNNENIYFSHQSSGDSPFVQKIYQRYLNILRYFVFYMYITKNAYFTSNISNKN